MSITDFAGADALERPRKVSAILADRLRAHVLARGLHDGDLLSSEADLIKQFGVARGTVREALRILEDEGLIQIRRGRSGGIQVSQPDLRKVGRSIGVWLAMRETPMRQLMEHRLLVEPAAAAEAARSATVEQRAWLSSLVSVDETDEQERAADIHEAIAIASNNDLFVISAATLHQGYAWHMAEEQLSPAEVRGTHSAHLRIVEAINEQSPDRAFRAMQRHLEDYIEVLVATDRLDDVIVPRKAWQRRSAGPSASMSSNEPIQ